jgi:shikimate dehydrogenase
LAGKSHDFTLQQSSYGKEHLVFCILSDERVFSSKSPDIFNQVMHNAGINGSYVPFMVHPNKIGEAMSSLRTLHIAGANITVPFKEAVMPFMDSVSESATIIGAINTIARNKEKLKGYNTNAIGLMDALEEIQFDPAGKTALILGAGGAAKAAAFVLKWLKADKIIIAGRHEARARQVAVRSSGEFILTDELLDHDIPVNILINATTVSSREESSEYADIAEKLKLPQCELIFDLNYGRKQNFWQEKAQKNGIMFHDGLLNLIHQAKNSLALWTGLEIETKEFRKALEKAV